MTVAFLSSSSVGAKGYTVHGLNGILLHQESLRRGETFVTRKISKAVANIVASRQDILYLGNLYAVGDWGYLRHISADVHLRAETQSLLSLKRRRAAASAGTVKLREI